MRKSAIIVKVGLFALVLGAFFVAETQAAKSKCPRDINCLDVYNPVTCSNGVTYPNACYAYRACATGCGSSGGGGGI